VNKRGAALIVFGVLAGGAGAGMASSRPAVGPPASAAPLPASMHSSRVHHYEYVFPDGSMEVYDADHGHRLVQRRALPEVRGLRGVAVSPATGMLYLSYGSDSTGPGSLLAYDLGSDRVAWRRTYPFGVDSIDLTPNGRRLYLPAGELSPSSAWHVIDTAGGAVTGTVQGGRGPHNTVVSRDGSRVYLGGRNENRLYVVDTATGRQVRRVGPLRGGVRPFTIDARQRLAFTTATGHLGFQVSSIPTGRVLYSVGFAGFHYDPARFAPSAPSHGISLSPDGRELWVVDAPNGYVHVFDVSGLPRRRPRRVADVRLVRALSGNETPCAYDCVRDGWLQHSLDGRFVYVGDVGEVIDTRRRRPAAFIPALRETRKHLEIDWRAGHPVATSTRIGLGR